MSVSPQNIDDVPVFRDAQNGRRSHAFATQQARLSQSGFGLFEVLIAATILAVAVAGVMRLHTRNLQDTAANDELQRAYWIVANAQQRSQLNHPLDDTDQSKLEAQAEIAGLGSAEIINSNDFVGIRWKTWDSQFSVRRGGCVAQAQMSCIQVKVK